ncbi:MAG TPA: zf-HC2 domain-containing protein [Vicinamibacterales bacterium]|nr:zf-HC2 domain-containing protein [Vicinamibacterales bacterium]
MTRDVDRCPDLETIAAYLDGRLDARERSVVAAHLVECADCYFLFRESAQTRVDAEATDAKPPAATRPARARRWWPAVAGALATAAAVWIGVGTGALNVWRAAQPELSALVAAVGTDRTVEGRLTGGFAYGPLRRAVRGAGDATTVSPDVRIVAAHIEKDAGTSHTQEAMRTLGIAHLVVGDIERAVTTLEAAANEPTADAATFSDLAAAYLARGAARGGTRDAVAAVTAAERAIGLNPTLAEASFNRADALERAGRPEEALAAWEAFLRIDATSGWADEARQHARALRGVVAR